MKKIFLGFVCLSAIICASSAQYGVWSSEFIEAREDMLKNANEWFLELDAAYFKFYSEARDSMESLLSPLATVFTGFRVAFEFVPQEDLPEELSQNFNDFFELVNSTFTGLPVTASMSLSMLTSTIMSMGMTLPLASVAQNFEMNMAMELSTIFMELTNPTEPISESCKAHILNQFTSNYEATKNKSLDDLELNRKYLGNSFSVANMAADMVTKDTQVLADKVNACHPDQEMSARIQCFQDIASSAQYGVWSSEFIEAREDMLKNANEWFLELDAAYFKFYSEARDSMESLLSPLATVFTGFRVAFEYVPQEDLPEELSQNFTDFFELVNSTFTGLPVTASMSLSMLTSTIMSMGMTLPLASVAQNFERNIAMELSTIFMKFTNPTEPTEPISESCKAHILNQFTSNYEATKNKSLDDLELNRKYLGNSFSVANMAADMLTRDTFVLADEIRVCGNPEVVQTTSARIQCVQDIVDEYATCSTCPYKNSLNYASSQISTVGSNIYMEMSMGGMGMPMSNPYLFEFLKSTCP
ncbi:CLUMA_CG001526, isoform A [Clunio marinus]|uniref:CLUMA_CG001526, isoform A n=1 Tax=Clunio marinus TaxID=568069 RepID=A0A1J1HI65_9DIPT|nr:CLUMA_CG001526, isoform A [Clunio marinus]